VDLDPAGIRICRNHRHVVGWRTQMVGLGHGALRFSPVAGLRNCV